MKGVVFSLIQNKKYNRAKFNISIKEVIAKYGLKISALILVFFGLIFGLTASKNIDKESLEKLNSLFLINFNSRTGMSSFEIFCSSFTADFIFFILSFIFAFSTFGVLLLPFVAIAKGFCIGLSACVIISEYQLSGIGFFIMIILPGTILFLISLIYYLSESFSMSVRYFKITVSKYSCEIYLKRYISTFLIKSLVAFAFVVASALLDTLLWILVSGAFNFS